MAGVLSCANTAGIGSSVWCNERDDAADDDPDADADADDGDDDENALVCIDFPHKITHGQLAVHRDRAQTASYTTTATGSWCPPQGVS